MTIVVTVVRACVESTFQVMGTVFVARQTLVVMRTPLQAPPKRAVHSARAACIKAFSGHFGPGPEVNINCLNGAVKDVLARSSKVAVAYCYTMAQILCGGRRYPTAVVSMETLQLLCLVMESHKMDENVIETFSSALRCVLRCSPSRVKDVLALDVLTTLCDVADMHVACESVQVAICQTLFAFIETCDFQVWKALRAGRASKVAARAVSEHMDNMDINFFGNQVLALFAG